MVPRRVLLLTLPLLLAALTACADDSLLPNPAAKSTPIPMDQIGAVAGKQYQGDGLSVTATPDGARLRCAFQKLEGQATREGLWLTSTADGAKGERFRVMARAVGRSAEFHSAVSPNSIRQTLGTRKAGDAATARGLEIRDTAEWNSALPLLPRAGQVEVAGQTARFLRPGVTEEYTVSVDGVRQDFVVTERPSLSHPIGEGRGEGALRLELTVTGATAEPLAHGARLTQDGSGRKIAYNRLRVTDANGQELAGRMEVAGKDGFHSVPNSSVPNSDGDAVERVLTSAHLAILVDDAGATYPLRIDPTFSDANWVSMGGLPGANNLVRAAVVDGAGNLYIGGAFSAAGNVLANRIAKWDGSAWSALGVGIGNGSNSDIVFALAVSGSNLYAGGVFTSAGGSAATNIARWNGSAWLPVGVGITGTSSSYPIVGALAASGTDLYVGGGFVNACGVGANHIVKWNGNVWSSLGAGVNSTVNALALAGTNLYVGGNFGTAGAIAASAIARWNGSAWSALGSGMGGGTYGPGVYALAVSGSNVYAGGEFTAAGGTGATNIAQWNGSAWSALGLGMNGSVGALVLAGTNLYAGGSFTNAGGSAANYIAKWDGSTWSALGTGGNNYLGVLAASGTEVYAAGGWLTIVGGVATANIAKWDGSAWSALGTGLLNDRVNALAVSGAEIFAGGDFPGGIAKWTGSAWSVLGGGISGADYPTVYALAVSGSNLYVGGWFTMAGGITASNIARWNGSAWSDVGAGMDDQVLALAVSGTNLYAAGYFLAAGGNSANYIAQWSGSAWSALGSGSGTPIYALAASGTNLYAAGQFAGLMGMNALARWNGSAWSALGVGASSEVFALAASGTDVYAGGEFNTMGDITVNGIAKWNGSAWSALGTGLNDDVHAIAVSGTDVYVAGAFATAGGTAAKYVAKWNGSTWSALGSGVNNQVFALAASGSTLYVGGGFTIAGGKVTAYVAKALLNGPPINLSGGAKLANGSIQFGFTNTPSTTFNALATTNAALPASNWTTLGPVTEIAPGQYQFTDPQATNLPRRFYRVLAP